MTKAKEALGRSPQGDLFAAAAREKDRADHPALATLRNIDPDSLSPKEALDLLYRLKKLTE